MLTRAGADPVFVGGWDAPERALLRHDDEEAIPLTAPNLFLIYVTDVERATRFYADLFEIEPLTITPRYVPFEVAPGVLFALWSGRGDTVTPTTPRASEVGLMVSRATGSVDDVYVSWKSRGVAIVEEPHDDVFGRTFVIADPDGNLIRVSPTD